MKRYFDLILRSLAVRPASHAILLFCYLAVPICSGEQPSPPAELSQGLHFYDNGHLLEACTQFEEHQETPGLKRDAKFFLALSKWKMMWLSTYDKSERDIILALLDEVEELCLLTSEVDTTSKFYHAASVGVRAQIAATDGDWWKTAQLGKKMKQEAKEILESHPDYYPAYYLIGSYNYFADALPDYVKFLRSLLFIPGGDRREGSQQLVTAYEKGGMVQGEAGKTLTIIYTYYEKNHDYGLRMCNNYLAVYPENYEIGLYKGVNLYYRKSWDQSLEWFHQLRQDVLSYSSGHVKEENKDAKIPVVPFYQSVEREIRYWIARNLIQMQKHEEARTVLEKLSEPEVHQPYWLMRGVFLSLAYLDYLESKPQAALKRIDKVLKWEEVKDSHHKAQRLRKKGKKVDLFDIDFL